MSKVYLSLEDVLKDLEVKKDPKTGKKKIGRFNKKSFNNLMVGLANDSNFVAKMAKVKGDEVSFEEIMVTKGFRKWCQKLLEKAGVDKHESQLVLSDDFVIDNMDGLYDFFVTAMYEYMNAGYKFDLMPINGFNGSIELKDVDETTTKRDARNPINGESLGTFEITKKKHKELKVKSSCPKYLSSKRKV